MPATIDRPLAVRCRSLTKTYGAGPARVFALRGIDLDVYRGELLMLAGPSGCGKTTFLSIVSAILDADEGLCEVLGHELGSLSEEARIRFRRRSVGFVFQAFNLLPALTAVENVAVPLLINGVPLGSATQRAQTLIESVGLAARAGSLPARLSGGQQQRVAVARALVHDPQLILCDEPTSNLDHRAGHETMSLLRGIAGDRRRTLIIVTHDTRIFEFADRVAYMDDGRIVEIGRGDAAARQP
jgi:putative ABC transport system ATP-binding protein